MDNNQAYKPGEVVYVIIRNPHAQECCECTTSCSGTKSGKPQSAGTVFTRKRYYPLTDEFAVFPSESEAEQAYQEAFGFSEDELGGYYG